MSAQLQLDLELALRLLDVTDEMLGRDFTKNQDYSAKTDGTPVCRSDIEVEQLIRAELKRFRPHDAFFGEETASLPTSSNRRWILDPLDHTRHFLRGNPEFATLLALTVDDETVMGVVSAPAMKTRWWATTDTGAVKNGRTIQVSTISDLGQAHVALAGHREWLTRWNWKGISDLLDGCSYPAGCPGGFLPQMLVAEGVFDAFAEPWGQLWDHAAPGFIVSAAGGRCSTLDGQPARGGSLLATNGFLHQKVASFFQRAS